MAGRDYVEKKVIRVEKTGKRSPQAIEGLPRLEFGDISIKSVIFDPDKRVGLVEPRTESEERDAITAVFLKVFNLPRKSEKSRKAMNVTARIRFYGFGFTKSIDAVPGVWLNSPCASTSIDVGKMQELFLVATNQDNGYTSIRDLRDTPLPNFTGDDELVFYVKAVPIKWFDSLEVIVTDTQSHVSEMRSFSLKPSGYSWILNETTIPPTASRMLR
jgi:hypothetical protein